MRFDPSVKNWRSYIPILDTIGNYRSRDFPHDLTAGLVVGVITVPQAIAYAFLAGLPPEAGLYACLAPMILYSIFGSSKQLVVGPVAVAALMVASAVGKYAPSYSDAYLGITTILCVQAGIFLLVLRLAQMGGIVNLLSHPVITGFVNAAAILIIISQIGAFTGLGQESAGNAASLMSGLAQHLDKFNIGTLAIGIGSVAILLFVQHGLVPLLHRLFPTKTRRMGRSHPVANTGPMLVAIIAITAVFWWQLEIDYGIAIVGYVPAGLPGFTMPPFELALWLDLAPVSAMIAFVSYVESFSIGTTLATRKRTRLNSNQELIALGAANIGAAFTGAYPVAGSFSRSSVNATAGGRTQVSSLVCALLVMLTLVFFTPLFAKLPHATLAAIVIMSVISLIDVKSFFRSWRFFREDCITQIVTLFGVLFFGVETGLLAGVAFSIAFFIRHSSRPQITLVGRIGKTEQFRAKRRFNVETFEHVASIRVDENIYFANSDMVENKLLKIVQRRPETKHLLLVCSAINLIDTSGLEMLYRVNESMRQMGIRMHLADVKSHVMEQLETTDFPSSISGSVFFTTDQAMRDLAERS